MKRHVLFSLWIVAAIVLLTGCITRVPTSVQAKDKLESAGYSVTLEKLAFHSSESGDPADQIIQLNAESDGEIVFQAFFFTDKSTANDFFQQRSTSLRSDVEAFHKFGYVICRGSTEAMEAFLK